MLIERGHAWLGPRPPGRHRLPPIRSTTAARCSGVVPQQPPTRLSPNSAAKFSLGVGELPGTQRVAGAVGGELGQPGVRHAGQRDPRVPGQVAQVLAHLARAGGAVEPDGIHAQRLQRGKRGADLAAEQHGASGLDRHVHDQRHAGAGRGDGALGAHHGRLRLQQVLAGLDDQRVRAPAQQARGAELVGVAQLGEGDVAERGQLGARPHRAENPARALVVDQWSAACRAIVADASDRLAILRVSPYSPRLPRFAPNELVVTQSTPAARYRSCTDLTMSGLVSFSTSLQPSWPRKSSSDASLACSIVPIAPSATTTRSAIARNSGT